MKSKLRDCVHNPRHPKYNPVKHSKKVQWEAKVKRDAGEITEAQYRLELKRAELILSGQWQHRDDELRNITNNKAQFALEYDREKKKSVLSTDLNKTQLPLGEREKQANKRAINKLAVQLFRRDYPDSSVRLVDCDLSVIKEYKRRAKYQILNTKGINRVTEHNPNKIKPPET